MALVLADRVKESTTTTGTGPVTLGGAATGYQSFAAVGNGNTTYYTIADQTGVNWEVGIGTYTASGTTLSRDTVLASSNAGALVNFGAGTKDVFVTYPADYADTAQVGDVVLATNQPNGPGTWLETGKYYSKAAYPALAAAVGDVPDLGTVAVTPQAQLPGPFGVPIVTGFPYITATDGTTTVVVGQTGAIRKTTDGTNWAPVPSGTTSQLNAVSYVNSNFVAVGNTGAIVTSSDGTNWVVRTPQTTNALQSIAFGNTRYVAVGASGAIVYSTDLVTWTLVANTGTNQFNKVVYANSIFVAVGASGAVYTSTDGVTWTNRTFQTALSFNDVVYANSVFVVITSSGSTWYSTDGISWNSNYLFFSTNTSTVNSYITATDGVGTVVVGQTGSIRRSTNGSTWSAVNSNVTGTLNALSYINSNFVAVGNAGAITTSSDGIIWTARTSNTANAFNSVAFGNTRYVAVGASGTVVYSTDLNVWAFATGTGTAQFIKVIYANSLFVAVGAAGAVYTSSDGITWTSRSAGANQFNDVIYANSLYVAVGTSGACYTSPDGTTWTSRSAGANQFNKIIYANSLFVAVGNSNTLYTSSDGTTWTSRTSGFGTTSLNIYDAIWNGTNFIVVGQFGRWASSSDGVTWVANLDVLRGNFFAVAVVNSRTIGFGNSGSVLIAGATRAVVMQGGTWPYLVAAQSATNPRTIAYNGSNQYVAVGSGGVALASSDGVAWTGYNTGVATDFDKVQYVNGNYIAMGGTGSATNLLTSPDGTTWTTRTAGTAIYNAAAFGAGLYVVVGAAGAVFSSPDLVTWTSRTTTANVFNDIVFANSIFVATGTSNTFYTSPDGVTWTVRAAPGSMNRIIYANSLFVAIGNSGVIGTSTNGTTWTTRTSNVAQNLNDIVWNGSVFCAVGANGVITTSPDGITWTAGTSNTTNALTSVSWDGTRFVVTNTTNSSVLVSTDGIVWTTYPTQLPNAFLYSTYAGGKFIAVGSAQIATSTNGINWTAADPVQFTTAIPGFSAAYTVTYSNSLFVISGLAGSTANIATSTDGITWTPRFVGAFPSSVAQPWHYCLWNGSAYYLIGTNGRYATSSDAVTWTVAQDVSCSSFYSVAVISGKTIAFGNPAAVILAGATRAEFLQSGTWQYVVSAQSAPNPRTIAYNGSNQYVAVGTGGAGGVFLSSTDGQTWTGRYSGVTTSFDKVQYLNGNYLAMGGTGSLLNLVTSSDGITWTPRNAGTAVYNAAAYGAGVYVVVGNSGAVFSSPDLVTWTTRSAGANTFRDIIFANSIFVAVGASNSVYSSTDGITWTLRTASGTFNRIIYANSLFVLVGDSSAIWTSSNGTTWTQRTSPAAFNINDVVWNGSLYCAVGSSGNIITSPDGINWTLRNSDGSSAFLSVSWSGTRFVVSGGTPVIVSTNGIDWSRASTAYRANSILYSAYLGGKFLAIGTNFIQTSTDGLNWTNCDHVQYVVSSVNKLYKLGSYYYAATSAGLFESSDGINFVIASRAIPPTAVLSLAYSGSIWLAVVTGGSGSPQTFYKSTDGTTWSKSADLGVLATNVSVATVNDLVYANGNFISGQSLTGAQDINSGIYTSSDGVTWTPRVLPYGAGAANAMASDGTTVVVSAASQAYTAKSTDGGVTWTIVLQSTGANNAYINGIWVLGTNLSTDLATFLAVGTSVSVGGYSANGKYLNLILAVSQRALVSAKGGTNAGYFVTGAVNALASLQASASKELPLRTTTLLVPCGSFSNSNAPYLIAEVGLYSYNTSTTFWVPPQIAGGGQSGYIYAGA